MPIKKKVLNSKEKEAGRVIKTAAVAKADKAWLEYTLLAPEVRTAKQLADLWSQKETARTALKKFLK